MVLHLDEKARPVDANAGTLQIRLAESEDEVWAAQALRYRVFYQDMMAQPTAEMAALKRDFDRFDEFCDHLLVLRHPDPEEGHGAAPEVIGTYRILRRDSAERCGRFYTSDEYDIAALLKYPAGIMEVGRSCVHPDFRNGTTMSLLWRGLADYSVHHKIDLMFGCASLPGTEPPANRLALAYLHRHHLAPQELRVRALSSRYVAMADESLNAAALREGWRYLPPLIKGYLRLGGYVGEGAVIDHAFGTTDVCIIVNVVALARKYSRHYRTDRPIARQTVVDLDSGTQRIG